MNNEMIGKIALVTGGSRGIGRAAALALAKAGADVAVNFQHREAEAQAVCMEIEGVGRRALAVRADVSKAAEVARLVEAVEKGLGGIDILVNNAGMAGWPEQGRLLTSKEDVENAQRRCQAGRACRGQERRGGSVHRVRPVPVVIVRGPQAACALIWTWQAHHS